MSTWDSESVIQWVSEPVKQWVIEPVKQWVNEPVKQWVSEPVKQWVSESVWLSINFSDFEKQNIFYKLDLNLYSLIPIDSRATVQQVHDTITIPLLSNTFNI